MGMPVRSKETRTTRPRVSKRVDEAKTQMNGDSLYDDPTLPTKTSATRTVKPNTQPTPTPRKLNSNFSGCVRRQKNYSRTENSKCRIRQEPDLKSMHSKLTAEEVKKKPTFSNAKGKINDMDNQLLYGTLIMAT
jgi:hypothetical protein